ncbi:bromodomain and phd finger-containing protein 3 [Phtheirospermum japonicum]|uniref:Bromodomain and phd finger-containing protein 3 n=1 Tax=Phtheirospermum japonicum TaxID=374723 RepID=A0A830BFS6_9LAMI|nr:bromodomain and phd finger-containing protein 3 [Phtheirospermum japonicum]
MGKVSTTEVMKRRKKKGRPPKNSLSLSTPLNPVNYDSAATTSGRSISRNPNYVNFPPPGFSDDGGDDDDERKEKKVKLVVRLPQSEENSNRLNNQKQQEKKNNKRHSRDYDSESGSGSDSGPESEDREACAKKRKIDSVDPGSDGAAANQEKKAVKATDTPLHESPLESGPTALLPDKKLLVFILDRLQKKDTYGVFSEPVDISELPDYFEVIKQPMDFGTVRKKLNSGAYKSLQELEPKVVRRGRPPNSKNQKKLPETPSPLNRGVGLGLSSAAAEDKANGSSSYNLRKAPPLNRFRSSDIFVSSYGSRNGANYSEWLVDWNDEFPANILRADMKYGKKQFTVDETRRDTYRQFHPLSTANNSSNSIGDMKRLVPVGLHEPLAYARSIARFAANLGPTAWKVASRKIESVLPAGTPYGPGWVGESEPHSQPLSVSTEKQKSSTNSSAGDCNSNKLVTTPSTSDLNSSYAPAPEGLAEAIRKFNSPIEAAYMKTPFPPVQQKQPVYQSQIRNGFGGMYGYNTSTDGASLVSQVVGPTSRNDHLSAVTNHFVRDEAEVRENWNISPPGYQITGQGYSHGEGEMWGFGKSPWPAQQIRNNNILLGPPDLNVRIPAGSPSSSLQIGSPQQPDLALQL